MGDRALARDQSALPANEEAARNALLHEKSKSPGGQLPQDRNTNLPEGMASADRLLPETAKSADNLNLESPKFDHKTPRPDGTMYTNEEGTKGYFRSNPYQNGAALSFSETHFGQKPEENYRATVNQFHGGLITYEYDNGAKIGMQKDGSGWIEMAKHQGSQQMVAFDASHNETYRVNITTDSSNNVTQEFSNGAIRKINADGSKYEKAVAPDGSGEERNYNSQGQFIATKQFSSPTRSDSEKRSVIRVSSIGSGKRAEEQSEQEKLPMKAEEKARSTTKRAQSKAEAESSRTIGEDTLPKDEKAEKVFAELARISAERARLNANDPQAIKEFLARNYNTVVAKPTEVHTMYETSTTPTAVRCREPDLRELQIVLRARERVGLNNRNPGAPPLRFAFSPDNINNLSNTVTYDRNRVFIPNDWRNLGHGEMMQDFHLDNEPHRESGRLASQNYSAEGTILHELGHWVDEQRGWRKNTQTEDQLAELWGFGVHRGQIGNMGTLTVGIKDKDERSGIMYVAALSVAGDSEWRPYTLDGRPLVAASLTYEQLMQRAKIPPGTKYGATSNNPHEASADNKTCLYLGLASVEGLLRRSPVAYERVRTQEQGDIDWSFGQSNGKSLVMRSFDGQLVPMTQANLVARKKAEQKFLAALQRGQ